MSVATPAAAVTHHRAVARSAIAEARSSTTAPLTARATGRAEPLPDSGGAGDRAAGWSSRAVWRIAAKIVAEVAGVERFKNEAAFDRYIGVASLRARSTV